MNNTEDVKTQEGLWIELSRIDVPNYARVHNSASIDSLAASMAKQGQLQNIAVLCKADGRYELIFGNGRLAAAQKLNWEKIQATVKEGLSEVQKLAMVASENSEREDASPFYTAMIYRRMIEAGPITQEELAKEVGKDQSVVCRYLALSEVPPEVWQEHQGSLVSLRQCLEIAKVQDTEHQKQLVQACVKEGLSGKAVKQRAKALKSGEAVEDSSTKEKAPEAPFSFSWKGNGVLVKGRLFKPHAETFCAYTNEMSDAYDKFVEDEKNRQAAVAA